MTQFSVLTPETKTIVVNFFNSQINKSLFSEPNKQLMVSLYSLMPEADSKVTSILNQYIVSLPEYFHKSQINRLKSEYPAVIKFCYHHKDYAGIIARRSDDFQIPQSLIDLCMGIAKPKSGSSVLVPYSGDGGFAYHVADCVIDGFENDEKSWAFSQILLHSQQATASIKLQGSFDSCSKKYDYIFSFPPMRLGRDGREIVNMLYNLITKQLQDGGEMYCVLPTAFCNVGLGWFNVRKILWTYPRQYSVLVVTLPPVLLPMSGINLCLFHVKKNHNDIVTLMDATGDEFSATSVISGYKKQVLKVQSIIETINSQDEKYVWVGNSSQLTGSVNLLPSRYLVSQIIPKPKEGEMSVKLSDVIQIITLTRRDEETLQNISRRNRLVDSIEREKSFPKYRELKILDCPLIGMKELSFSYLNCDINREDLTSRINVQYQVLTKDCLLVGFIGGKFKVGRLHGVSQEAPVCLRNEIIPIRVVSTDITEDFLLRSIMSEPVQKQAQMMASGVAITRINKEDLLSIVINVPQTKEQQDALMKEDTRSSLTEADRKIIQSYEDFRKDMHMKKHAIGQTIFNINNWWNLLKLAREKGSGIVDDNAELGTNRRVKVADIYSNIETAILKLSTQLSKLDSGYGLQTEIIDLPLFIEKYIAEHKSPIFEFRNNILSHQVEDDTLDDDEGEMSSFFKNKENNTHQSRFNAFVQFAPEALTIIFDNIISNACAHGFDGRESANNLIIFDILAEGTDYIVSISNNGKPIVDLTPEEVFTYSLTTGNTKEHFGIGGYEIKKLMNEFRGDVQIISTPNELLTVTYRLIFHDTK